MNITFISGLGGSPDNGYDHLQDIGDKLVVEYPGAQVRYLRHDECTDNTGDADLLVGFSLGGYEAYHRARRRAILIDPVSKVFEERWNPLFRFIDRPGVPMMALVREFRAYPRSSPMSPDDRNVYLETSHVGCVTHPATYRTVAMAVALNFKQESP